MPSVPVVNALIKKCVLFALNPSCLKGTFDILVHWAEGDVGIARLPKSWHESWKFCIYSEQILCFSCYCLDDQGSLIRLRQMMVASFMKQLLQVAIAFAAAAHFLNVTSGYFGISSPQWALAVLLSQFQYSSISPIPGMSSFLILVGANLGHPTRA